MALGGPGEDMGTRVHLAFTRPFSLQMMMQYLYHGGTESMHIPTADILEVRFWPTRLGTGPSAHLSGHLPGLKPTVSLWRAEGREVASVRPSCFSAGPFCV